MSWKTIALWTLSAIATTTPTLAAVRHAGERLANLAQAAGHHYDPVSRSLKIAYLYRKDQAFLRRAFQAARSGQIATVDLGTIDGPKALTLTRQLTRIFAGTGTVLSGRIDVGTLSHDRDVQKSRGPRDSSDPTHWTDQDHQDFEEAWNFFGLPPEEEVSMADTYDLEIKLGKKPQIKVSQN